MTAVIAEQGLAGHPFSVAIKAQLPLDVWDLGVFGYSGGAMTARFKDRADRAGRGATGITQRWLLESMKEWVLRNALRRVSSSYIDDMILSVAMLSATLRERDDGGDHPDRVTAAAIQAELANTKAANQRLRQQIRALERRLGEFLGVEADSKMTPLQTLTASAAPSQADLARLSATIEDLQAVIAERDQDLQAARRLNADLTRQLNQPAGNRTPRSPRSSPSTRA